MHAYVSVLNPWICCGGKTSLEGNNSSSSSCYVTFLVYFLTMASSAGPEPAREITMGWLWGSRLKMLGNKCYSSYCLLNSFFHHILPHKTWHISQIMSGTPMRYQVPSIQCDFSVLEWLAMIVLLSSLFSSGWVLQVLEHEKIPSFFFFDGKDGEDRTRDLTVHNLTSCRRRHCEEVDEKCYATNATRVIAF